MKRFLIFFLARRTLFSTRERFVPLLACVTLLSITLGVFFLVVVLATMRGFQTELNQRWIGLNAHLTLKGFPEEKALKKIQTWPEVQTVQKFVAGEVILQTTGEESQGVAAKLKGWEELPESFLGQVRLYPGETQNWSLLAGDELLSTLQLHPDFKEKVTLITPFGEIGPTGDFVPHQTSLSLSHVFRSGLYLWDAYTVVVPFETAQKLLGDQAETGVQIYLKSLADLDSVQERLAKLSPNSAIENFAEQNQRLFAALKLERLAMTILLTLFLLIATFSIAGLLFMFLSAKQLDLAILRAIGLPPAGAKKIYLALGGLLGGIGTLLGGLLGIAACFLLKAYPITLPATYYLDYLPIRLEGLTTAGIFGLGILLTLISAWYPARLAQRLEILPLLREE